MRVSIGDVALFFDVEGAKLVPDGPRMRERPTLVVLHGGPGFDHSLYKPYFSPLAEVAQVVYVDHRGQGRSDASTPDRWTLAQWGDDVRAFCDALGIERPVVLGTSFGGFVAMSYALRHPDHPSKLILDGTAGSGRMTPVRVERMLRVFERLGGAEARAVARRAFADRGAEALGEYFRVCYPLYTRSGPDPDATARRITKLEVLSHFEREDGEGARFDFLPQLGGIRCPTLVMGGEEDPVTPIEESLEIAAALPPHLVRLERFPGCGHGVWRDDPARGLAVIRDFLLA